MIEDGSVQARTLRCDGGSLVYLQAPSDKKPNQARLKTTHLSKGGKIHEDIGDEQNRKAEKDQCQLSHLHSAPSFEVRVFRMFQSIR